jgi:hypothetical protein
VIRTVVTNPEINIAELAQIIGVNRHATVRGLVAKIKGAPASANPSVRLVGLDTLANGSAETSAP